MLGSMVEKSPQMDLQMFDCVCSIDCDCENPDSGSNVDLVSMECPFHNLYPQAHPDCHDPECANK